MPIAVSPSTSDLLDSARHYVVRPNLVLQGATGFGGEDLSARVKAVTVGASMDQPTMRAQIDLTIGDGIDSLSPFISASMHNAFGAPITTPATSIFLGFGIGTRTGLGEMVDVFEGRLDRVLTSYSDGVVRLLCRDISAWWMNTMLQKTFIAGSDGGTEASVVMQQLMALGHAPEGIVGDPLPSAAPSLQVAAPLDWILLTAPYSPMPILEAMRIMAQQAGRDVRWIKGQGGLVYYEPDRAKTVPDLVLPPKTIKKVQPLEWGDEDVRNIWELQYQATDSSFPPPLRFSDTESVARYGPRFSRIFLNRADNIKDDTAATRFGTSALEDNKNPFASHQITKILDPRIELNDLVLFPANNREYDTDLQFSVSEWNHSWRAADRTGDAQWLTTIKTAAKPIAAYRAYRRSIPPKIIYSTLPDPPLWAPEGTVFMQVDSLAPVA